MCTNNPLEFPNEQSVAEAPEVTPPEDVIATPSRGSRIDDELILQNYRLLRRVMKRGTVGILERAFLRSAHELFAELAQHCKQLSSADENATPQPYRVVINRTSTLAPEVQPTQLCSHDDSPTAARLDQVIDEKAIGQLGLPSQIVNALTSHGLSTVADLGQLTRKELTAIRGIGRNSADRILTALEAQP